MFIIKSIKPKQNGLIVQIYTIAINIEMASKYSSEIHSFLLLTGVHLGMDCCSLHHFKIKMKY